MPNMADLEINYNTWLAARTGQNWHNEFGMQHDAPEIIRSDVTGEMHLLLY